MAKRDTLGPNDYDDVTPLKWAEYELATIEYDYKVHPEAAKMIRNLFKRLAERIAT
ncbi:hypothetical protein LCGC14_2605840 [marine sediment metagenome]|uniref:Uncharacterized protein n=1 Tax=marine sediment metagenome TaxID=412755 RepID=A0A0F9AV47_9ZZZZ